MNRIAALVLAATLTVACTAPDQFDPTHYGSASIAFANAWAQSDVDIFVARVPALEHLGPHFVLTMMGPFAEDDCHGATYCVHHWDSGATTPGCPMGPAAQWRVGTGDVDIDPVCVTLQSQKEAAFEHEIGHALGMSHVCLGAADSAPDCSSVGTGDAVMNPYLTRMQDGIVWIEDYSGDVSITEFTALDLAEFRRTHP